jgi:hypothetical protein
VADEVYAFMGGGPQSDDLTVLALRYLGHGSRPPEAENPACMPSAHGVGAGKKASAPNVTDM